MKVLYIPGFLGSSLEYSYGQAGPLHRIWVSLSALLEGEAVALQLGPGGQGPGFLAQGRATFCRRILRPVYGPLADYMQFGLGWDVQRQPWDWRQDLWTQAAALLPQILYWAGNQPIYFVAHSAGGLLARALYSLMDSQGLDSQCARIVTLGCPHYGTFYAAASLQRAFGWYQDLAALVAGPESWVAGNGPAYLDAVVASWPALYQLLPFAHSGPLFQAEPQQAAALYTSDWYQPLGNPFVSAAYLAGAPAAQDRLTAAVPLGRLVAVATTGSPTAYLLSGGPASLPSGYLNTQLGDGVVTRDEASPAGAAAVYTWDGIPHALQVVHPTIWAAIPGLVTRGAP